MDPSKTEQVFEDRRRNLATLSVVHRVGESLRLAWTREEVWGAVRSVAEALGASAAALRLAADEDEGEDFSSGFDDAERELFVARFGVGDERTRTGDVVELGWDDGRMQVDRDTEIAVELLCEHVAGALERVRAQQPDRERAFANVVGLR